MEARPPSASYRLSKFVRKHRTALAMAASIALLLLAGAAVSAWQAVRATAAERRAILAASLATEAKEAEAQEREKAEAERNRAEAAEKTGHGRENRMRKPRSIFSRTSCSARPVRSRSPTAISSSAPRSTGRPDGSTTASRIRLSSRRLFGRLLGGRIWISVSMRPRGGTWNGPLKFAAANSVRNTPTPS